MAKPRGLRASSGYSRPTVTVEKRTKAGVFSPTAERKLAFCVCVNSYQVHDVVLKHTVRPLTSLVVSKYPKAPDPQGCTMRSRFFDRLKVCCFWNKKTSLATGIPPMFLLCALFQSQSSHLVS